MTMVLYTVIILFGLYMVLATVIQWKNVFLQRKIIDPTAEEKNQRQAMTIDYTALIVKNSRWLTLLDTLDKRFDIKLRIISGFAVVLFLPKVVGFIDLTSKDLAMILLIILIVVVVGPAMLLKPEIKTRINLMMDGLPYFIDLTAVCVQSGMTVESALRFIGERFDELDINLASLVMAVVKRAEVSGLAGALEELYRSMAMTEMRMFCSTLQQSVHYGTSLYENLLELSKDIRELQLLTTEEKVGKLSAKMSIPLIMFIMFPIVILIAAPGILRIMKSAIF